MNKYFNRSLIGICAFAALTSATEAADPEKYASDSAKANLMAQLRGIDELTAPIRSTSELHSHLQMDFRSPLNVLNDSAKWAFVDSLRFSERGLSSFRYDILSGALSIEETYKVLQLFGEQNAIRLISGKIAANSEADKAIVDFYGVDNGDVVDSTLSNLRSRPAPEPEPSFVHDDDHVNYACVARATCGERNGYICTSNC